MGSPVTNLYSGAFGRSAADRNRVYSAIPKGADILITHAPPFGILDQPPGTDGHDACRELLAAVNRVRPRLHVFGHIHGAWGTQKVNGTVFVNATVTGQYPELDHAPVIIEL